MDYVVILLRLIHIVGGIAWVGSSLVLNFYVGPTVAATQEGGQQFMRHLMLRTRFTQALSGAAIMTVLAGIALYARDAGAGPAWQSSGPGIGYGIGGAFGLAGLVFGMLFGMTSGALARTAEEIQGQPTDAQQARLESLRKRLALVGPLNVYSLLISAIMMAIARYLVF